MTNFKNYFKIAFGFFLVGTLLLILQLFKRKINLITITGLYYVQICVLINTLIVIFLMVLLGIKENKKEILKSMGIILLNIPIAYFYFYLVTTYII